MPGEVMSEERGAIVLGGSFRALAIARSLGRRGIPVWVLKDEQSLATHSRYCRRSIPWPDGSDLERVGFLVRLAAQHQLNGWMLFPTTDFTAALVARYHDKLSQGFLLTTVPWEQYRLLSDKRLMHSLAGELGIPYPRTFYPQDREEVGRLECAFPVVIKPSIKEGDPTPLTHAKALRANDRNELVAYYDAASSLLKSGEVMVQEFIPGGVGSEFHFSGLCAHGEPIAYLTARCLRQYPLEFTRGSTLVETAELPELEIHARRLLQGVRFTGVVDIAFMRDPRDKLHKLLDVNPRAWNWGSIGHRAGMDFYYLLWRLIRGDGVVGGRAEPGIKWVHLSTDLVAAVQLYLRGQLSWREYLRSLRGPKEWAVFAADDPLPVLADLPLVMKRAVERRSS